MTRFYLHKTIIVTCLLLYAGMVSSQTWIPISNSKATVGVSSKVLEESKSVYKVNFLINGIQDREVVKDGVVYHQLSLNNYPGLLTHVGEPELPVITHQVALPAGATYKVKIVEMQWDKIAIGKLYPAQNNLSDIEKSTDLVVQETVYNGKEYTPEILNVSEKMRWRGIDNINIAICPFKYYPQDNTLSVLSQFILQVEFAESGADRQSGSTNLAAAGDDLHIFGNIVTPDPVTRTSSDTYDYFIILATAFAPESSIIKKFRRWKAYKGHKTKLVTTATTGTTCSSIKNYIAQEYANGVRYVLFIGDDEFIPLQTKPFVYSVDDIKDIKTDYWYGCMDGEADMLADIAIGRFPTNSFLDLENMINKTIAYESSPITFTDKALLIANKDRELDFNFFQYCLDSVYSASYTHPLDFTKAYGADASLGGNAATNSQLIDYINNGMNIVNYRGHGTNTCWDKWNYLDEDFCSSQISSLNAATNSVYFSVACFTGDIRNQTCMMETFLRSDHGAVAFIGATEKSARYSNTYYNRFLFTKLLNQNVYRIGDLNLAAHIQNISLLGTVESKGNAFSYICGGDPTLEIWTTNPEQIGFVSIIPNGNSMTISTNSTFNKVYLVSEDGEFLEEVNLYGGSATFVKPEENFFIAVNRQNHIPYIVYCNTGSNYIQNTSFDYDAIYTGSPLQIGYDVTTDQTNGNVYVNAGNKLEIKNGYGGVLIKNGFECKKGATLNIE